jgi:hypothetical protein
MTNGRKNYKIRRDDPRNIVNRIDRFAREGETTADTFARLLDEAGVSKNLRCAECDSAVQTHVRDPDGTVLCLDCAGVSE